VTVPEIGTIRAGAPPLVVLTSNRTREVHDALKRRCLYQWIDYPTFDKELSIVSRRAPEASAALARQVTAVVQELRASDLYKKPGVSETSDWLAALVALDARELDPSLLDQTLGVVLKAKEDLDAIRERGTADFLDRAMARAAVPR
jgi:MoxR-like ATPase